MSLNCHDATICREARYAFFDANTAVSFEEGSSVTRHRLSQYEPSTLSILLLKLDFQLFYTLTFTQSRARSSD